MKNTILIFLGLFIAQFAASQITVNTNFKPNIAAPLDLRSKINTLADTATIPFVYDGSIAYVVSEDVLYFKNSVKWIEVGGVAEWATIVGIPTDIADGDDDSQLSQAEVNAFETDPIYSAWDKDYNDLTNLPIIPSNTSELVNDSGFITSPNDADFDPTNELQTLTDVGATFTLSDGGGSVTKTVDTDTQLSEAQVDAYAGNNGYLLTEVDGSIDNEIQTLTDVGATFTLSDGGGTVTKTVDTNTQLTEAQVDAFADNNGYLETEVDGSISNELQTLTDGGATFTLSDGGGTIVKTVDTDTQLTEAQVDAFADNNGYLESEVDGSVTNELQTISKVGSTVTLSDGGGSYTDAVNDADFDPTNEIQDTSNIDGLQEFVETYGSGGAFDGDRAILRVPEVGAVLGTSTVDGWLDWWYVENPQTTISFSGTSATYEIGTSQSISYSGTVTNLGGSTLSNGEVKRSGVVVSTFGSNTTFSHSETFAPTAVTTYTFQANQDWTRNGDSGNTTSSSRTVRGVYPVIYGMSSTDYNSSGDPYADLTKLVATEGNKTVTISGSNAYIYYLTPTAWSDDDLSSILDPNGFEIRSSFTKTTISVSSSGLVNNWTHDYTLYKLNNLTTANGSYQFKE